VTIVLPVFSLRSPPGKERGIFTAICRRSSRKSEAKNIGGVKMRAVPVERTYQAPVLRKLPLPQVKAILLNQADAFLNFIFPRRSNGLASTPMPQARKEYQKPELRKLTPEQAKLLLIGHASVGNERAKEIAGLLFAESGGFIEPRLWSLSKEKDGEAALRGFRRS
jgi:hypothetical protein